MEPKRAKNLIFFFHFNCGVCFGLIYKKYYLGSYQTKA